MTTISRASTKNSRGRPLAEKTLAIRDAVMDLTVEYEVMTVRQIFYQLVARGVIPKDENRGYRPVQQQVLTMRRDGILGWDFVADGTRWQRKPRTYDSAEDALASFQRSYRRNLWQSQGVRCEVWLEKDALAGVVVEATNRWDVALMVSRGTSSATFIYSAGQEALRAAEHDVSTHVFTLYDYDAAGERCHRAVERGLLEHVPRHFLTVQRLAITAEQVALWNLPTRPAKATDPEAQKWSGDAVELDAIPPDTLVDLVENAIIATINVNAWQREQVAEESELQMLALVARRTA